MTRWSKSGGLRLHLFQLQQTQIRRVKIEAVALDGTLVKVHPDGTGALKNGPQAIGRSRGGWTTKTHRGAADARTALTFALSPGQAHDAPEGRTLRHRVGRMPRPIPLLMDRAYEGDATRQLTLELGYVLVMPPKHNRRTP